MRKCCNCLCRTCMKNNLNSSCGCKSCEGKIKECKQYSGFRQLSIFEQSLKPRYQKAPRHSWDYYGISKERYKELAAAVRSGKYASLAQQAAHTANEMIAEYILLSVTKKRSYEAVEYAEGLGRIPCGRTDFYGYRRLFYHLFDLEVRKRVEKNGQRNGRC